MKIINATWEERNLGLKTQEIEVQLKDTVEDLSHCLVSLNSAYQVLKIPSGRIDLMLFAEKEKFNFVETQFHSYGKLSEAACIASDKKFNKYNLLCSSNSDNETYGQVIRLVNDGIFGTDRIALDNNFGVEIANRRYANWIGDLQKNENTELRTVWFNKEIAGFLIGSANGKKYKAILGGVVPKYQGFLGFYVYGTIFRDLANKYEFLDVAYSSNNLPIVKLYEFFKIPIKELTYIYIKHV